MKPVLTLILPALFIFVSVDGQEQQPVPYKEYIQKGVPVKKEIDVFLNELSWSKFDPELGYKLGNFMPHDGYDQSATISTAQPNGARTSMVYANKRSRINSYGNSFTQCHQVSDAETWQEYLAAHLGEPIRNFGMGGYGAYQAYRRLLREEKTKDSAEYLLYYIWGDDHIRSLLRCRYMLTQYFNDIMNEKEGVGKMFHGNFWSNIEMDFDKGKLVEKKTRISTKKDLYKMTDSVWMYENLKDDLALQMALYTTGVTSDVDKTKVAKLASILNFSLAENEINPAKVGELLNKYAFHATKYILGNLKAYAAKNNKKLMVILFDPYVVMPAVVENRPRYDQEIVDYLVENKFNYFDMNEVHAEDFKKFKIPYQDYFRRYLIGHYNPAGNHFFAFAIKPRIVEMLNPKPITYQELQDQMINFKGYLDQFK